MKVFHPHKTRVGEHTFYIWPFKAFVSANLSGDLLGLLTPVIGSLLPFIGGGGADGQDPMDVDVNKAAPVIGEAFNALSGNRLETMLRKLLLLHENITVDVDDEDQPGKYHAEKLTEELVDELFCGEIQDMYILAFKVIQFNFSGFFTKLGSRFGGVAEALLTKVEGLSNMDTST